MLLYIRGLQRIQKLKKYLKFANSDDLGLIWIDFSIKIIFLLNILKEGIPEQGIPKIINNQCELKNLFKETMNGFDKAILEFEKSDLDHSKNVFKQFGLSGEKLFFIDKKNLFEKHILDFPTENQIGAREIISAYLQSLYHQAHIHKSLRPSFIKIMEKFSRHKEVAKIDYILNEIYSDEAYENIRDELIRFKIGFLF